MDSIKKAAMTSPTLTDLLARWREIPPEESYDPRVSQVLTGCADELLAWEKQARELAEKWPHDRRRKDEAKGDMTWVCRDSCQRCQLLVLLGPAAGEGRGEKSETI